MDRGYLGAPAAKGWSSCILPCVEGGSGSGLGFVDPTIRAKKASIACKLSGQRDRGSAAVAATGASEPAAGNFSFGVGSAAAGVFSNGSVGLAAVVVSFAIVPLSLGEGVLLLGGGVSKLPRITGKPSLGLPMITTFEFVDCAS